MYGSSIDVLALYGNGDKWYRCHVIYGLTYLTELLCSLLKVQDSVENLYMYNTVGLSVSMTITKQVVCFYGYGDGCCSECNAGWSQRRNLHTATLVGKI
jgi:hypothetical protein